MVKLFGKAEQLHRYVSRRQQKKNSRLQELNNYYRSKNWIHEL